RLGRLPGRQRLERRQLRRLGRRPRVLRQLGGFLAQFLLLARQFRQRPFRALLVRLLGGGGQVTLGLRQFTGLLRQLLGLLGPHRIQGTAQRLALLGQPLQLLRQLALLPFRLLGLAPVRRLLDRVLLRLVGGLVGQPLLPVGEHLQLHLV